MLAKNFTTLEKLGVGTYSTVYKVKRISDGKNYALKKVRLPNLSKKGMHFSLIFKISNDIFHRKRQCSK